MSEQCNSNCSSCNNECAMRKISPNENSRIKKVIGIVSGKGGVGKSTVTSLLASALIRLGKNVAILDGDITGPSIPKAFAVSEASEEGEYMAPAMSKNGTKIMSVNLLLENETDPVVWRGPIIAGTVKQFFTEVNWGDVDYMLVDMPPGTGDVVLTVFQSLPLDGIIVVSTPQHLVGMIVEKAVKMARKMNVPVLGMVENMSYLKCPDCDKIIDVFGESHIEELAKMYGVKVFTRLPINTDVAKAMDNGTIENYMEKDLAVIIDTINSL